MKTEFSSEKKLFLHHNIYIMKAKASPEMKRFLFTRCLPIAFTPTFVVYSCLNVTFCFFSLLQFCGSLRQKKYSTISGNVEISFFFGRTDWFIGKTLFFFKAAVESVWNGLIQENVFSTPLMRFFCKKLEITGHWKHLKK